MTWRKLRTEDPQIVGTTIQNPVTKATWCLSQMKHQLGATLCRFYFCRVTLSDSAEIKPAQCCSKLVFHLTYTMMHGSTKLKFWCLRFVQCCTKSVFYINRKTDTHVAPVLQPFVLLLYVLIQSPRQPGAWVKWNTNLMQHCAGFISAESLWVTLQK